MTKPKTTPESEREVFDAITGYLRSKGDTDPVLFKRKLPTRRQIVDAIGFMPSAKLLSYLIVFPHSGMTWSDGDSADDIFQKFGLSKEQPENMVTLDPTEGDPISLLQERMMTDHVFRLGSAVVCCISEIDICYDDRNSHIVFRKNDLPGKIYKESPAAFIARMNREFP